jgi:hypothetical protein
VARSADLCLYLHAGTESSVAATKTCTASFAAAAAIVSSWKGDEDLSRGLAVLSADIVRASQETWPTLVKKARTVHSLFVLGRGVSLPLAFEVALKFKETCGIHAEAYSLAEVMHGPVEILGDGQPLNRHLHNFVQPALTFCLQAPEVCRWHRSGIRFLSPLPCCKVPISLLRKSRGRVVATLIVRVSSKRRRRPSEDVRT